MRKVLFFTDAVENKGMCMQDSHLDVQNWRQFVVVPHRDKFVLVLGHSLFATWFCSEVDRKEDPFTRSKTED